MGLQCRRSRVALGKCMFTDWVVGVLARPRWAEMMCPYGTVPRAREAPANSLGRLSDERRRGDAEQGPQPGHTGNATPVLPVHLALFSALVRIKRLLSIIDGWNSSKRTDYESALIEDTAGAGESCRILARGDSALRIALGSRPSLPPPQDGQ
jgi:hypothetical protein